MNVPKLRFKEFSGDWQRISLSGISTLITKGTTPRKFEDGNIKFLKIEAIGSNGFDISKCQTISDEIHNNELKRSILKEGDILFAIAGATIGKNAIVENKLLPANTNQALAIIRLKEPSSRFFVLKVLSSPLMEAYIDSNISTGAQPNLNLKQIGEFSFQIPELVEQTKIASFLTAIDGKIAQLTQKHELLSQYKKGVVQQIFSQQLRFKDDNGEEFGEWEEMSLGDVFNNYGGTALEEFVDPNGSYNFISIGNYLKTGNYFDNGQRISLNEKTKGKILNKNDLVMVLNDKTASGDLIGATILITEGNKFVYNQRSERLVCDLDVLEPKFAWHFLNSFKFRKELFAISQGGTQIYVNFSAVKKLIILIPTKNEQTKIANFLSSIDQKIDQVAAQLDAAKQYKRGLLQQMFV
jgi:type I restriction enzyme S subunit